MEVEKGKLYSFKIKHRAEKEQAIVLALGKDWILGKWLFDYQLDGYVLFSRKYIGSFERGEREIFWEEVLKANNRFVVDTIDIPLSTDELMEWLHNTKTIFQIEPKDETVCYIGYTLDVLSKSIRFKDLTSKGVWVEGYELYRTQSLMLLKFDSDYINCLVKYNTTLEKQTSL